GIRWSFVCVVHGTVCASVRVMTVDAKNKLPPRRLRHPALAASDVFFDDVFERIGRDVGGLDQALFAARHIGDDHRSAASAAFSVQRFKNLELHDVVAPISVRPLPAGYAGRPPPQGGGCTESAAGALLPTS